MTPDAASCPASFKRAIDEYGFPGREPIYSVGLSGQLGDDNTRAFDQRLVVFRPAGKESGWHQTIEAFWASVLFNFLEDCFDDRPFEKLGQSGEYRLLSGAETKSMLGDLIGSATSDYISLPVDPTICFLAFGYRNFKAFVGSDAAERSSRSLRMITSVRPAGARFFCAPA